MWASTQGPRSTCCVCRALAVKPHTLVSESSSDRGTCLVSSSVNLSLLYKKKKNPTLTSCSQHLLLRLHAESCSWEVWPLKSNCKCLLSQLLSEGVGGWWARVQWGARWPAVGRGTGSTGARGLGLVSVRQQPLASLQRHESQTPELCIPAAVYETLSSSLQFGSLWSFSLQFKTPNSGGPWAPSLAQKRICKSQPGLENCLGSQQNLQTL